ncbi:hypothetical protein Poli38472_010676 [Pythium oligandrum]|uniref:MULE transposase domain-containing protein n=1 Tax=Pythium oligandrum TaxID=41045 RepID=A0A8K1CFJ1_PYTOL|nr:hypothetical protein Poli38472_010676 [Pythium oligandrum]|eukprot:TMW61613.1 hypothetical protein Poli38472_010676 [Pythium oligandrum]
MQLAVDRRAIENMSLTPEAVWAAMHGEFYSTGLTDYVQRSLTRKQVISRIHRVRRSHFDGNLHGVVEVPPLSLVSGAEDSFFRFQHVFVNSSKLEQMIGRAHPDLLLRMQNRSTTIFVDGTFRCVTRGFYQCLVFMVFDYATDFFLPAFYVLLTLKTQEYWNAIAAVLNACDEKPEPDMVVCYFESALMDAV